MTWGKADSKTATGTVSITTGGAVTGTGTAFTTEAAVGDYITVGAVNYLVRTITSDTAATVAAGVPGAAVAAQTGQVYALSEKPSFESQNSNGNPAKVFGVSATEAAVAGNKAKGLGTAGWVKYHTYTDAQGATRHKAETLVAMGTITGDAADDATVADA